MSDNPSPFEIHPDEHIEARITAWVLGEASPFEAAELEALVENSPELRLFHNRIRNLHALLPEAEDASGTGDDEWKLPHRKKIKLTRILGGVPEIPQLPVEKESRIRRASFRAALAIAACVVVTFFVIRLVPRDHEAEVTLEIRPPQRTEPLGSSLSDKASTMTPQFFGTEFEKIKSRKSLEKVIDNLDLTTRWDTDKESALKKLRNSIETKNIRGTDLLSIRVRNPNEEEAQQISLEVAEGYREYRNDLEKKSQDKAIAELKKAVREQEDKVEERRKLLTTVSRTKDIAYYGDRNMGDERKRESLERSIDTQDYVDAKREFEADQALLEQMKLSLVGREIERNVEPESIMVTPNFESDRGAVASREKSSPEAFPLSRARFSAAKPSQQVHIGGQVNDPGPQEFKEGLTLGEAVASAGGANAFGSSKRVKVYRDGKATTYDLSKDQLAQVELKPGDTIEMPQKNWFGCGASRDELTLNLAGEKPAAPVDAPAEPAQMEIAGKAKLPELQKRLEILPSLPDGAGAAQRQLAAMDAVNAPPAPATKPSGPDIAEYGRRSGELGMEREVLDSDASDRIRSNSALAENDTSLNLPRAGSLDPSASREGSGGGEGPKQAAQLRKEAPLEKASDLLQSAISEPGIDAKEKKLLAANENESEGRVDSKSQAADPFADVSESRGALAAKPSGEPMLFGDFDGFAENEPRIAPTEDSNRFGQARAGVQSNHYFNDSLSNGKKDWNLVDRFSDGIGSDGSKKSNTYAFYDNSDSGGFEFRFKQTPGTLSKAQVEFGIDTKTSEFKPLELPDLWEESGIKTNQPVTPATPTTFENQDPEIPILGDIPIIGGLFQEPQIDLADLSQEIPATQEPFSTFSLNISDASFQIARAAIEKGERPDPASIKPEQFYNAIDYGDPAPSSREPVAAAIDQTAHPVIPGRNLVRIGIRTASTGRSAAQPLCLTLLVDQSGSMVREDRRAAMETALEQLATLLTEQDRITVIGFSRTPRLLADSIPGNQANKLPDLINQTASEGGTNLEQAINLASELALRHKLDGAQNRIVLFTDGAANLGNANPERLSGKIETLRQQGLAFDIAGIGTNDLNDNLLAELARHGNGRYYLVGENTGASLAAQLAGAFRPAAENVKVQVKLNPERVGNYKLIGFEKDRLKTEDFRNDSIDAAELAADEAGVAMYQVETLPEGSGEIGEVSVRFRNTASGEIVERTWTIAYDPTTPSFDKADPKTQLATLSLLAAQELQGGPLSDAINLGNFAETIAKLRQTYKTDPKTQQLLNLVGVLK